MLTLLEIDIAVSNFQKKFQLHRRMYVTHFKTLPQIKKIS